MTLAMMVMMICSTLISQTSNSSSSGSRKARTKTETFLESNGQNLFRSVEKSWKKNCLVTAELQKIKNAIFWPFSPSWGNWPICAFRNYILSQIESIQWLGEVIFHFRIQFKACGGWLVNILYFALDYNLGHVVVGWKRFYILFEIIIRACGGWVLKILYFVWDYNQSM